MNYDLLVTLIHDFGYVALFFSLWLGIVGMPIPDEVIVMTGGALTGDGTLLAFPAFILTYLGVISGISLGYVLGRFMGEKVLERLRRKNKIQKYLIVSENLINKYGSFALCISYFLPIVRHVMPYVVGLNQMSFKRYALYAYTTGFVWTLIYFTMGSLIGIHIQEIGTMIYTYGMMILWFLIVGSAVFIIIRYGFQYNKSREGGQS